MTSVQILQQFLNKSLLRPTAEKQLNVLVAKALYPETAKARAALAFIIRYTQYNAGEITSDELLLSLRDTILFLGKFSVPKALFDLTSSRGKHYDLICEPDQFVACEMKFPAWFNDFEFVNQVYGFDIEPDALTQESVADDILKAKTVYSDYKSFEQKAAVYSAMKLQPGCTLLISLPTGSGKSLVTQMLALESPGLTLVIVPTVALALDQYNAAITSMTDAQAYGIFCYRGEQDVSDYHKIIDALKARKANLLFTSPEAILRNPTLHKVLEECAADHYIDNLVIDEAHIVPDWGTFFRPDFQVLSVVLNKWKRLSDNHIRTYLLSATLSDDVVSSLKRLYSHDDKFYEFRCDSLRREPKFCYYPAKTRNEQDEKLLDLVVKLPKPMIVYVLEPEEAVRVKKLLKEISMKNVPVFSGKTNDSQRGIILKGWKNGQYDIVVATSAFGIGVDKPDVRTIIHKCTPENLSRFYQEVGRAGRDGMPSLSVLLPYVGRTDGESDLSKAFGLVNKRVLRVDSIVTRWFSMTRSSKSDVMGDSIILDTAVPPSTFTEEEVEYAGNRNVAWNVNLILLLLRTEFIDITDVFYSNETRSYHFSVKLLRLADMRDEETLAASLSEPRQNELDSQLEGYFLMRDLVQKPERACWGAIFKKLFPLAKERCNGCPKNKEIISASEDRYKIRVNPGIPAVSEHSSPALRRIMGGYNRFILRKNEPYDADVSLAIKQMEKIGVGALVIPDELKKCIGFSGMVLTHDEFLLLADYSPSLFAGGCMTVFQNDAIKNNALFLANQSLERHGYRMVYYCDEDMFISSLNRDISNFLDCYIKDAKSL